MDTKAAKNLEFTGNIQAYQWDSNGIRFVFKETPTEDDGWSKEINIPFEVFQKYRTSKVKITIEKIKE